MIQNIYVPNAVLGTGLWHLSHEGVTFKWIQEGERYDMPLATVRTGLGGKEVGGRIWGEVGASSRDGTTDLFWGD